jgi:hypothetical protein
MARVYSPPVTGPMANAIASPAAAAVPAAVQTAAALMSPRASGLSVRPAAASLAASQASLDQPMDNCPASSAGAESAEPMPCGAACAASNVVKPVIAREGPGWLVIMSARTRFKAGSSPSLEELSLDQFARLPVAVAGIPRGKTGRTVEL